MYFVAIVSIIAIVAVVSIVAIFCKCKFSCHMNKRKLTFDVMNDSCEEESKDKTSE